MVGHRLVPQLGSEGVVGQALGVLAQAVPIESLDGRRDRRVNRASAVLRSEEHTSELQSHSDLVCRLLLEKKKVKCKFEISAISPSRHAVVVLTTAGILLID